MSTVKTYKSRSRFRLAGTTAEFRPYFTTDDPDLQAKIEGLLQFKKGSIVEVKKGQEKIQAALDKAKEMAEKQTSADGSRAALEELSRADLVALAKRLEVKASGKNTEIISRIVEASEQRASGSSKS